MRARRAKRMATGFMVASMGPALWTVNAGNGVWTGLLPPHRQGEEPSR
jgi:hypothetical protein